METLNNQNQAFTKTYNPDTESVTPRRYIGINWQRLSSLAWKYMLPLAITLSIFSAARQAFAVNVGATGSEVKNLQEQLKAAGFYSPNPTGYYGDVTQEAIRKFQRANKLPVTGLADATTLTKLQSRVAINPTPSKRPQVTAKTTITNEGVNNNQSNLVRGDSGVEVKSLQERLRVAGFYTANSTGVFGVTTEAAVRRFQQDRKLVADGIVGPATLSKLPPVGVGYGDDNSVHMRTVAANTIKTTAKRENLHRGDRGPDVLLLQDQLKKLGLFNSIPNGIYGPFTEAAVRQFQSTHYLQASGVAGPTTRGKLVQVVSQIPQSEQNNVVELQSRLQRQGFYDGPVNGVMGNETRDALIQAQHYYGVNHTDVTRRS